MADAFNRSKMRVLDRAMRDSRLTPASRLVFYEIIQHVNRVSGDAWPSEVRLADRLGINLKTVVRALPPLKLYGYIDVKKTGRHNTYRPVFDAPPIRDNLSPIAGAQGAHTERAPANLIRDNLSENRGQIVPSIRDKNGSLSSLREPHKENFSKRDQHEPSFRSRAREATATPPGGSTFDGLTRKDDGAIHLLLIKEIGSDAVDALHAIDDGRPLQRLTALRRERSLTAIELDHARQLIEGNLLKSVKRAAS